MINTFIYGLPKCDSTQKAIKQLKKDKVEYTFINFKEQPATAILLSHWCQQKSWEKLLNKRSTTWKTLDEHTKANVIDEPTAIAMMALHNNLIKRPIITINGLLQ